MTCFYSFMMLMLRLARIIFFRNVEVSGIEFIPPEGEAVIFAGNHPNALVDPSLLMIYAGRPIKTMAKSTIFFGPFNLFFRSLGAIPVYRVMDDKNAQQAVPANDAKGGKDKKKDKKEVGHKDEKKDEEVGSPTTGATAKPPSRNSEAFREVDQVLRDGGAFSIFPEGISHSESQLLELKSGLAHMALGFLVNSEKETGIRPTLTIVPVGFSYTSPDEFRSDAWIKFGEGFSVPEEIVAMYAEDDPLTKKQAVKELTDIVASGIRRYTVTAPDWETVELTILSSSLYRPSPPGGHASRPWMCWCCAVEDDYRLSVGSQTYLASILRQESVVMLDDAVMNMTRLKVADYNELLKALDCSDDDVRIHRDVGVIEVVLSAVFYFLVICILMPLSIPILILNLPILFLSRLAGRMVSNNERDTVATYTILASAPFFVIFYGLYIGILSWVFAFKIPALMEADNYLNVGVWVVFFTLMIPTLSFITLRMWEEILFAKQHCFRLYTLLTYKGTFVKALALRQVCHELVQATIVLLGNEEVYAEARDAFPDVTLMSRQKAYEVVVEFANANDIDEDTSLLLTIAKAGQKHGEHSAQALRADDELRQHRSTFYQDESALAVIDRTSLNQHDALARSVNARKKTMARKGGAGGGSNNNSLSNTPRNNNCDAEGVFAEGEEGDQMRSLGASDNRNAHDGSGTFADSTRDNKSKKTDIRRVQLDLGSNAVVTPAPEVGDATPKAGQEETIADRKRQDETAARYNVFGQGKRRDKL